ncbi:hypothetical protein [Clostridium botulinum]|uniref:hypothetical protein n=1 Tax=Clostridium botulinum TaxID=1491 RepID=UPI000A8D05CC|nr:hypothetical protein [Clostridium botulinum]KAI3350810.1 hypothetical protein CIT18_01855 [Clostridium botulinum]
MLILRINIAIARKKIYLLDKLFFLPSSFKEKCAKKVCDDIIKITNKIKLKKIIE